MVGAKRVDVKWTYPGSVDSLQLGSASWRGVLGSQQQGPREARSALRPEVMLRGLPMLLELGRAEVAQGGVLAVGVVPALEELESKTAMPASAWVRNRRCPQRSAQHESGALCTSLVTACR